MSQLRKLAQNYPTQETGGGELGDIDEDDEVPGIHHVFILSFLEVMYLCSLSLSPLLSLYLLELVGNFDEPSKSEV